MRPRKRASAEKGVDPRVDPAGDRGSWGILVRRARGCEGAKPPCHSRAPSGAHIKKPGRRPDLMGGTQLGRSNVVTAGSSARDREAIPPRLPCPFVVGTAESQNAGARS